MKLPVTILKNHWNGMTGVADVNGKVICLANEREDANLIVAKLNQLYTREDWLREENTFGTVHEKTATA